MELINETVIIGILSVFSILLILYLIFDTMNKISHNIERKKHAPKVATTKVVAPTSGDEIAAVIATCNLYLNTRDEEKTILTIKRIEKSYSPWSSKALMVYNNVFYKNK